MVLQLSSRGVFGHIRRCVWTIVDDVHAFESVGVPCNRSGRSVTGGSATAENGKSTQKIGRFAQN
jgi:hypothetical protein